MENTVPRVVCVFSLFVVACGSGHLPGAALEYGLRPDAGTLDPDGAPLAPSEPGDGDGGAIEAAQREGEAGPGGAEAGPDGAMEFVDFDASMFLCDPSAQWGPGQAVLGLTQQGSAQSLALTPDELTIAWVEANDAGAFVYRVAGRASAADPVGNEQTLALDGLATPPGISLSVDGLTLALVKPNQSGFVEATRTSASEPFGTPAESEFKSLNAWVATLKGPSEIPRSAPTGVRFSTPNGEAR